MTSSCHRCLGLPTGLVPVGFQSNSFLVGLAWSILCIGWSRGNACFSYKNNFVYFQHKKILITQKEGILMHLKYVPNNVRKIMSVR
jgi:hypothetical protein